MMYQIAFFILLVLLVAGIFSRRNRQPRSSFCIDQDYCTTFSDFRHYDIVCIRNSLKRWTAMNSVCYWCFALYWTTSTLVLFSSDSMNTNTCGYILMIPKTETILVTQNGTRILKRSPAFFSKPKETFRICQPKIVAAAKSVFHHSTTEHRGGSCRN